MEEIKRLLDEQKHICQTEFDKRSKFIDGIWYVACEDVLNAPYPKQLLIPRVVGQSEQLCDLDGKTVLVKFKVTKHIPKIVIEDI